MTCERNLLLLSLIGPHESVSGSVCRLTKCMIIVTWLGLRCKITATGYFRLCLILAGHKRFVIIDKHVWFVIALITNKRRVKRAVVGIKIRRISFPFLEVLDGLFQSFKIV